MLVSKIGLKSKTARLLACGVGAAVIASSLQAREFEFEVVKEGLISPTGIVAHYRNTIYFTEVPTPGTPGSEGGENAVKRLDVRRGTVTSISDGEPYPKNIAIDRRGSLYWTCQTAGVILKYDRRNGKQFFLPANGLDSAEEDFLMSPSGVAVDRFGDVLFTEVPIPGTFDANLVSVSNGETTTIISDFEPNPVDIAISNRGSSYWTCNTAGVIFQRSAAGVVSPLTDQAISPVGIAVDPSGRYLYYTEVPTPGIGGDDGGSNKIIEYNLRSGETTVVAEGFPYPADVTVASDGSIYWTCKTVGVIAKATLKKEKKKRYFYYNW